MKNRFLIGLTLLMSALMFSQTTPFYVTYNWDENPQYQVDPATSEEILGVKNKVVTEFLMSGENNLEEYYLEHKVLWLNSDSAIEYYNKIYLPFSSTTQLVVNRARVITKDGKVLPLDESDILTASDEETGRQYKYFAFKGIEKGTFIEYYYILKKQPEYQGKKINLQSDVEWKDVSFDLYSPEHLVFKVKSYNKLPEVNLDTLTKGKLHWGLAVDKMDKLEDEEGSPYNAMRAALVYKLDKNLYNNTRDIVSYGKIAQNIYGFYYPEHGKKTLRALEKFVSEATTGAGKDEVSQVRALEYFIKNNFMNTPGNSEDLKDIETIISRKVANETGIIKLYTAALKLLDIKHEIVITSDREVLKFDPDFEAINFLTDFLIYFPDFKMYMSPTDESSRIGFPPAYLTDNYGLYIKEMTVGNLTSGVGKIDYIQPVKAEKTFDEMHVNVTFDPNDLAITEVKLDRQLNGYYSMYIHPYMHIIKEEDKKEILEGFALRLDENAEILEKEVRNGDSKLFGIKPLQFVLQFRSEAFIEKAGNKYLFKIGEIIGEQIQLYQEKQRVLPMETEFQRSYYRTLTVEIPEGYKIANPDDLIINNVYFNNKREEILSFQSSYTIENNILTIKADEHYRQNFIDVEIYEQYRTVINSAADFNKITLILEEI
ncbi:MAG: DUF3857 domain-containing protein [Flavobacteriaceae bacterium]